MSRDLWSFLRYLAVGGGGYGYGVTGSTHQAIEGYGVMLALPGMRACIPGFDEDIEAVVAIVAENGRPTYLRFGRGEPPIGYVAPPFAPWRRLTQGRGFSVRWPAPISRCASPNPKTVDRSC
jgi:transketolase